MDPGLVEWASSYLNESLTGWGGARMIANRIADPNLGPAEAEFIATLGQGIHTSSRAETADETLYVDGAAGCFRGALDDLPHADG